MAPHVGVGGPLEWTAQEVLRVELVRDNKTPPFIPEPHTRTRDLMLIPTSWLFIKGDESVWIYRPTASDLLICGPRSERLRCGFANERGLESYQADLAADLLAAGWQLLGEGYDRRQRRRSDSPAT